MVATSFDDQLWDIPVGVPVFTVDQHRLGRVVKTDAFELLVQDTNPSRPLYAVNLFDVERYEDGTMVLKLTAAEAAEQRVVG